jgi:hypothetical protein
MGNAMLEDSCRVVVQHSPSFQTLLSWSFIVLIKCSQVDYAIPDSLRHWELVARLNFQGKRFDFSERCVFSFSNTSMGNRGFYHCPIPPYLWKSHILSVSQISTSMWYRRQDWGDKGQIRVSDNRRDTEDIDYPLSRNLPVFCEGTLSHVPCHYELLKMSLIKCPLSLSLITVLRYCQLLVSIRACQNWNHRVAEVL